MKIKIQIYCKTYKEEKAMKKNLFILPILVGCLTLVGCDRTSPSTSPTSTSLTTTTSPVAQSRAAQSGSDEVVTNSVTTSTSADVTPIVRAGTDRDTNVRQDYQANTTTADTTSR
jgi:hypothetical protein